MSSEATVRGAAVVDLFCGIGGLSHGFVRGGFDVVAGVDADASCRYAFETNNEGAEFVHARLEDVSSDDIASLFPKGRTKILVGCAPCQPFSAYVSRRKKKITDRWKLLQDFRRIISEARPEVVTMENVPRLQSFDDGAVLSQFVSGLEAEGYYVEWRSVDCSTFGVPQTRWRLVLLASRLGEISLIPATHDEKVTVRDAIGELPTISHGSADPEDRIHCSPALSDINYRRIRASAPGGTWEDWPRELVAACHRKKSGKSYRSVYGRMAWDEPAPTITTGCFSFGRGRFGHPEQDRAISLREASILQTFPGDYAFVAADEPVEFRPLGCHIGNRVKHSRIPLARQGAPA